MLREKKRVPTLFHKDKVNLAKLILSAPTGHRTSPRQQHLPASLPKVEWQKKEDKERKGFVSRRPCGERKLLVGNNTKCKMQTHVIEVVQKRSSPAPAIKLLHALGSFHYFL